MSAQNDYIDLAAYLDHIEDAQIALRMAYELLASDGDESAYSMSQFRLSSMRALALALAALDDHSNEVRRTR